MEQTKKTRSANRTHEDIRIELERRKAKHYMQISQIDRKLEALDKPREPRKRKPGAAAVLKAAQAAGFTNEQLLELIAAQKGVNASL